MLGCKAWKAGATLAAPQGARSEPSSEEGPWGGRLVQRLPLWHLIVPEAFPGPRNRGMMLRVGSREWEGVQGAWRGSRGSLWRQDELG